MDEIKDPRKAAALFAFLEYPYSQIVDYLVERNGLEREEAEDIAQAAVEQHAQKESESDRTQARDEAAQAAEHDLSETNWR